MKNLPPIPKILLVRIHNSKFKIHLKILIRIKLLMDLKIPCHSTWHLKTVLFNGWKTTQVKNGWTMISPAILLNSTKMRLQFLNGEQH